MLQATQRRASQHRLIAGEQCRKVQGSYKDDDGLPLLCLQRSKGEEVVFAVPRRPVDNLPLSRALVPAGYGGWGRQSPCRNLLDRGAPASELSRGCSDAEWFDVYSEAFQRATERRRAALEACTGANDEKECGERAGCTWKALLGYCHPLNGGVHVVRRRNAGDADHNLSRAYEVRVNVAAWAQHLGVAHLVAPLCVDIEVQGYGPTWCQIWSSPDIVCHMYDVGGETTFIRNPQRFGQELQRYQFVALQSLQRFPGAQGHVVAGFLYRTTPTGRWKLAISDPNVLTDTDERPEVPELFKAHFAAFIARTKLELEEPARHVSPSLAVNQCTRADYRTTGICSFGACAALFAAAVLPVEAEGKSRRPPRNGEEVLEMLERRGSAFQNESSATRLLRTMANEALAPRFAPRPLASAFSGRKGRRLPPDVPVPFFTRLARLRPYPELLATHQ